MSNATKRDAHFIQESLRTVVHEISSIKEKSASLNDAELNYKLGNVRTEALKAIEHLNVKLGIGSPA